MACGKIKEEEEVSVREKIANTRLKLQEWFDLLVPFINLQKNWQLYFGDTKDWSSQQCKSGEGEGAAPSWCEEHIS